MPMDFPDMPSLASAARVHRFRQPLEDEDEAAFRAALADYVRDIDFTTSYEIRFGVGWDQWTPEQTRQVLDEMSARGTKHLWKLK